MMSQQPEIAWTGRLPRGLIGMLVVVALVEVFVERHRLLLMDSPDLDWLTTSRLVTQRAVKRDILCFGDSMLKFGIAPRLLDAKLKCSSYNMALLDGKPAATYYLFRRALAAGARPSAVLVDFQPEMLSQPTRHLRSSPRWDSLMLEPGEALDLAWNYRDADFFARLILSRYLPSIRCRSRIRTSILAAFNGQSAPESETIASVRRNWQVNHGAVLMARQPSYQGDVPNHVVGDMFIPNWKGQPANVRYIDRFLKLAFDARIPVFWILPPNVPKVINGRSEIGLFARYEPLVREALERFTNLTVIDARHSGFAPTVFVDPVHLDRQGAAALTVGLADVLRTALVQRDSTQRWLLLPPFREPTVTEELEDVGQSRSALQLNSMRVRR
jgi:hypothetical protein